MAQSGFSVQIAESRKNILEILEERGFDISNYKGSSISEVHTMLQNNQLDMLVKTEDESKSAYVKYHLGKTLRATNIYEYIEDLFNIDNILQKKDDLVIIARDNANDSIQKLLRQIWIDDKIFITVIGLKSLQFNIMKHTLVPPHRVMSQEEKQAVYTKYNIIHDQQIPDISRFSPPALAIGIRPGELCEILRPSKTAITAPFYRICSQ